MQNSHLQKDSEFFLRPVVWYQEAMIYLYHTFSINFSEVMPINKNLIPLISSLRLS